MNPPQRLIQLMNEIQVDPVFIQHQGYSQGAATLV
jgi:hypothetical protein